MSGAAGGTFGGLEELPKACKTWNWAKSSMHLELGVLGRLHEFIQHALLPGRGRGRRIQSASAHSAGPLCFFVGLWLVGLWFVGLWPSIVLKNALAEIGAKFQRKLAQMCKFTPNYTKKGPK